MEEGLSGMSIFNNDIPISDELSEMFHTDNELQDGGEETIEETENTETTDEVDQTENKHTDDDQSDQESVVGEDESNEGEEDAKDDGANSSSNLYSSLAAVLSEKGIISLSEDSKISDAEALIEAVQKQVETAEYADLTADQKEYLSAIREGVPHEVISQQNQVKAQWDKITDEAIQGNEQLRQQLIVQDLKNKGYNDDRIQKHLKRITDLDEDYEEAVFARDSLKQLDENARLKAVETAKVEAKAVADNKAKRLQDIEDSIYKTDEIIKGVKISKSMKDKVYKSMTDVVGTDTDGNAVNALNKYSEENPVDYATKIYYMWELTNGFQDFSKLEKQSTSKAVKKLEKILKDNHSTISDSTSSFLNDPQSYSNVSDFDGHSLVD